MSSASGSSTRPLLPQIGCGYAVCALLGAAGVALILAAGAKGHRGERGPAWVLGALGVALCGGAAGLIGPMRREVARARERQQREDARPDEPWTWIDAWRDRNGIPQSGRRNRGALLFFGVAALVVSLPMWFALPAELAKGNHAAWVGLVFPVVGVGILLAAGVDAWRHQKYGTARFVPAAVPIPFGTEAAGMVVVDRIVRATGAGRAALDCWCTTRSRRGGKTERQETVLSHVERAIAAADWTAAGGDSRLFVQLPLRGGAPTSMHPAQADLPEYEWRLRVEMPTAGADFVAEFVLPIFEVAGAATAPALPPAVARAEIWRAAGLVETPQAAARDGMALVLPRGEGRKLIVMPLLLVVIFGGLAGVLWWSPAPGFIAVFLGLFALLPALTLPSLWSGGGERLWCEDTAVCTQRGAGAIRRVAMAEIQAIEQTRNVGVGAQQFYRIVARCRPENARRFPRRVELAAMVRGDEAAQEVITWLEEKLTDRSRA